MGRVTNSISNRLFWLKWLASIDSRKILFLCLLNGLVACSSPAVRIDHQAKRLGFQRQLVKGSEFFHVVYLKGRLATEKNVHVYIEGDGVPWIRHKIIAKDPTPDSSLMLKLMALDENPALIYLGRPCFHGLNEIPPCSPLLWTHQRYSKLVIESLAMALKRLLKTSSAQITLLGHSGGGTLAVLLARQLTQVSAVVTLAANLDITAWSQLHHYSPLQGSLNPVNQPPLRTEITQLHIAGADDENVPAVLIRTALQREPRAQFLLLDDQDHRCCWEKVWPSILKRLKLPNQSN